MAQTITSQGLRALLLQELEKQTGLRRKQLIEACVRQLDFSYEELADRSPGSSVVRLKSRLGQQLTSLQANGDITESEAGYLAAAMPAKAVLEREGAAKQVLALLSGHRELTRRQIYEEMDKQLKPLNKQAEDSLHALLGQTISALEREKRISRSAKGYRCAACSGYPNTELGSWLSEAARGGDLCSCFLGAVHTKGGEWLEYYAVQLIERYYSKLGLSVTAAAVTGGSNDGGLDGTVETTDSLGFREVTLLQMKNRYGEICARDVREFYGAVCAAKGTRGIYVTVSTFHSEAQRLLDKVPDLIGIDGRKLFELAAFCGYGVKDTAGGRQLDAELFLAEKEDG